MASSGRDMASGPVPDAPDEPQASAPPTPASSAQGDHSANARDEPGVDERADEPEESEDEPGPEAVEPTAGSNGDRRDVVQVAGEAEAARDEEPRGARPAEGEDDAPPGGPGAEDAAPSAPSDAVSGRGADGPPERSEQVADSVALPERPVEPPPDPPDPPDPAEAARRRLVRALAPRATRSQLLAAAVCALLGFAGVVQARQSEVQELASLRESELIAVLDNVTQESARLDAQIRSLEQTLEGLRTSSDRAPAAREAAQKRLEVLGVLAGTLPASGPGIEVEIPDPQRAVNATEILETVQELRDAGAEVMQIGPVRVVASTALVDDPAGLLVDMTVVSPPYKLQAIGDPRTLAAALEIPGGILEVLRNKGVSATVRTQNAITITALRSPRLPEYARPAQPSP